MITTLQPFENDCLDKSCSQRLCQKMKQELGFFSFLSEVELENVSPYFNCLAVKVGNCLWESGEPSDYVAFIVSGKVQLKVDTEFPGKQVVVGVFGRGAAIGVSSTVVSRPRSSTARALEDTGLIIITPANFEQLTELHPRLGVKLLKGMLLSETTRLNKAYARLASIF
jgi:CRP/FNR family cyclic AMP-dependent transcriptional regulator